jgi:hypothetical protein
MSRRVALVALEVAAMTKLLHEIWRADGGACTAITCCLAGPMGDQARAMLEPGAYLLQVFWAASQCEASTIRNKILGFEPYQSEWEEIDSQPYSEEWATIQNSAAATDAASAPVCKTLADRRLVENLTLALMKAATTDDTTAAHQLIADMIAARGSAALPLFHQAEQKMYVCARQLIAGKG